MSLSESANSLANAMGVEASKLPGIDQRASFLEGVLTLKSDVVTAAENASSLVETVTQPDIVEVLHKLSLTNAMLPELQNVSDALPVSGGSMLGNLVTKGLFSKVVAVADDGVIDVSKATCFTHTVSTNITFSFSNAVADKGCTVVLALIDGNSAEVSWPESVKWEGDTVPTLSSELDVLVFTTVDGGTTWYGTHALTSKEPVVVVTAPSGRKFYRHSSGMGTVMCFNDGQDREVLVLDAQYRGTGMVGAYDTIYSLPNYTSWNINNNRYMDGSTSSGTPTIFASLTDATLNSLWANSIDANTAKHNCDVILAETPASSEDQPTAITHARSILVDGTPCDVPNIQTLQRICCDAEFLDSMDPTVSSYSDNALGSANPNGVWLVGGKYYIWASTSGYLSGPACSWYVNYQGWCSYDSRRDNINGVVPVLEL